MIVDNEQVECPLCHELVEVDTGNGPLSVLRQPAPGLPPERVTILDGNTVPVHQCSVHDQPPGGTSDPRAQAEDPGAHDPRDLTEETIEF